MLEIFDEVAMNAILVYYPNYERIHAEVHVRVSELPLTTSLRDLRRSDLNTLVRVLISQSNPNQSEFFQTRVVRSKTD